MARRALLGGCVAAVALAALPSCVVVPPPAPPPDAWPEITAIGTAYLVLAPAESSRSWLGQQLGNPAAGTPPDVLLTDMAATVIGDYAAGNVIFLDGWYLSVTQCRIAAFWATRDADD